MANHVWLFERRVCVRAIDTSPGHTQDKRQSLLKKKKEFLSVRTLFFFIELRHGSGAIRHYSWYTKRFISACALSMGIAVPFPLSPARPSVVCGTP